MNADDEQAEYEALLQFLYIAPIGVAQATLDGHIVMANPLCAQLLMPLSNNGELENLFDALQDVAPDLRHRVRDYQGAQGSICDSVLLRIDLKAEDDEARILSLSLLKIDARRLMAVISDVTQSVKRERELRQSQAWMSTITSGITDYSMMTLDHQGRIKAWNPSIARLTGFQAEAAQGATYDLFYVEGALPGYRLQDRLREADVDGWSLDEGWRLRADGTRYWGSCLIAPLDEQAELPPAERAYSLIVRDITDRREAHEAMRRSVLCDHLTGLANRRAFTEAGELEIQRWTRTPRPLSLVLFDADHFKLVNDRHGHLAGDAVLRHLSAGLRATFRTTDLVARIGGEEFVALLPGTTLEGAEIVAARLCQRIASQTVDVDGTPIRYTVSAGVAVMEAGVENLEDLFKRADAALYQAKSSGRNRVERWTSALLRQTAAAALC
jgi:diguanylate cyclase (GGDEF)-like protein/PAS domain S-box-containing protein